MFVRILGILFVLISAHSCTGKSEFKVKNGTAYIKAKGISLSKIQEVKWKVGKYGKKIVSRGVRISFEYPRLDEKTMDFLYKKREVTSWLIRLRKKTYTKNHILGYASMIFANPRSTNPKEMRYNSPKKGTIGVNYAASSISMRLDRLPCPALNHRKRITDYGLKPHYEGGNQTISSGAADLEKVASKVSAINYSPLTINGGMNLNGNYFIELALYNKEKKLRLSNWIILSKMASIEKAEEVFIKECQNYTVPDKERGDSPANKFKFGR